MWNKTLVYLNARITSLIHLFDAHTNLMHQGWLWLYFTYAISRLPGKLIIFLVARQIWFLHKFGRFRQIFFLLISFINLFDAHTNLMCRLQTCCSKYFRASDPGFWSCSILKRIWIRIQRHLLFNYCNDISKLRIIISIYKYCKKNWSFSLDPDRIMTWFFFKRLKLFSDLAMI